MTSKFPRSALIAALAVGASGLVAVPAASAADTQYYVNAPAVTGVASLTPESAVLTGVIDTGGNLAVTIAEPGAFALPWAGGVNITTTAAENIFIDGIPESGASSVAYNGTKSFNSSGEDNFSSVEFEYDPVTDYDASGDTPGPDTQYATSLDVPTTSGLTPVKVDIGAFGVSAQNSSGSTPLTPGTKYYYWVVDQAGETDDAEDVNTTPTAASASYSCVPDAEAAQYYAADPVQGPCLFIYGNNNGADYYQSPTGEFTTPKLGTIVTGASATIKGKDATLTVKDASGFKASGDIEITTAGGTELGSAKFALAPNAKATLTFKLSGKGVKAAAKHSRETLVLTSNWDQPASTKSVKL